jgi:hypothetical protein
MGKLARQGNSRAAPRCWVSVQIGRAVVHRVTRNTRFGLVTRAIHTGYGPASSAGGLTPPIHLTSTIHSTLQSTARRCSPGRVAATFMAVQRNIRWIPLTSQFTDTYTMCTSERLEDVKPATVAAAPRCSIVGDRQGESGQLVRPSSKLWPESRSNVGTVCSCASHAL